ncbi:MAG: urease accessory protein UreF [Pseudomonadota bacterium]
MTQSITPDTTGHMAQMRLWQLISPTLPVGAYAYSQGLESAIENQWITNESQTYHWISGILSSSLAQLDAPVLLRFSQAWFNNDIKLLNYWNQFLLASRESSELLAEDIQMGKALMKLLMDLENKNSVWIDYQKQMLQIKPHSYLLVFSLAVQIWKINIMDALRGFLWSWCENQVAAAIKLVPLGQTAGQRLLSHLMLDIEQVVKQVECIKDNEIGSVAQGLSILSAQHQFQYSRLFRS